MIIGRMTLVLHKTQTHNYVLNTPQETQDNFSISLEYNLGIFGAVQHTNLKQSSKTPYIGGRVWTYLSPL